MSVNTIHQVIEDIKNEPVGAYLESEHRNFAIYTISQRAIPFFNGLKPVQQRCLWQLRNVTKFEKVAKLTGMTMSLHPHGDCIFSDSEVLLADGTYQKIGDWYEESLTSPENSEKTVVAFDREKGVMVHSTAKPIPGKIVDEYVLIEMENGECLRVSPDHLVLLDDGITYIRASELTDSHAIKSF